MAARRPRCDAALSRRLVVPACEPYPVASAGGGQPAEAAAALSGSHGFVLGNPVHRSTYSSLTASFLEAVQRAPGPLAGKPVAIVMTAAAPEHLLATERLNAPLGSSFAALCLTPELFLRSEAFEDERLSARFEALARAHGEALGEQCLAW
ncbi:NAD(P)H-dependent oxidoreductase [Nocardioides jensenii]|uniref:NAD(P)H-dependent oxidoreductase n=1 Tax=Nocardioides jensenii TaxID=1843 RepID=UPI003898E5B1